jgi:hypothetical protein
MKKVFFSLLAVAAIASCAKTEPVYMDNDSEINFAPVTSMVTKAQVFQAVDGTEYPAAERFTVIGYWADEPAGSAFETPGTDTPYLDNVEFAKYGQYWAGYADGAHFPYYWPKNGSLRFACYSPSNIEGVEHELATDTWTATGYVQSNDTDETIDFMVAKTPLSYTAQTAAENVSVVFEHALSWIEFKVKAQDEVAAAAYTVKSVTVNNVATQGDMVAEYPAKEWTVAEGSEAEYVVFEGTQAISTEAADIVNTGVLVIPQATTEVTIEFEQNSLPGVIQKAVMNLDLDAEATPWEPGKHYIYTILFTIDEIFINPSVADWEDVNVGDIEVGVTDVFTADQLAAAFKQGGKVVLKADIETETSFTVAKGTTVEFDLNGFTVAGTDVTAKNYGLIYNNGSLTVNDSKGNGKLTATATTDSGTSRYSAVISNNPGGSLVVNGGTIEHLGGTYMAYGIDNLTNSGIGDVKCVINGGAIKSSYRGIRQFLNSDSKKNELYITGGTVEGPNRGLFFHDPSAKANNGTLVVTGGEITGTAYLYVTPGSAEWPVTVSIAEDCIDDVVAANVPEGYTVQVVDGNYVVAVAAPASVAAGETVTLASDVVAPATVAVAGTLDGNGNTIAAAEGNADFVSAGMFQFIRLNGGEAAVQNITVDGNNASATVGEKSYGVRNIVVTAAGTYNIDNVKSVNATYPLHVSTTADVVLNVTNSTFQGWTSYNSGTTANFKSVAFTAGNYARFRPYGTSVLENCSFDAGFVVDLAYLAAGETVTFVNCTYNGAPLTDADVLTVDGANTMAGTYEIK